jgi:hypothetical protein
MKWVGDCSMSQEGLAMPVETFEYRNEAERVAMLRAFAFVAQMHDLALSAPAGQVIDACEQQALGAGRDLLRATMEEAVQARVNQAEEKKGRPASARAGSGGG